MMSSDLRPAYPSSGFTEHFKVDPGDADSDTTVDRLVDRCWLEGSGQTVIEQLGQLQHETGGFGRLMMISDFVSEQNAWRKRCCRSSRRDRPD